MTERNTAGPLVMFDLDGTLIDSVGGIAHAVNAVRRECGLAPLSTERVRGFVGNGARKLMERSLADAPSPVSVDAALAAMVDRYAAEPLYDTRLYPGVAEGLEELARRGALLAVVSNKPDRVGRLILEGLGIAPFFRENMGAGALHSPLSGRFPLKPAPDAVLYLLEKYAVPRDRVWFVGDHHTDLRAAEAAGVRGIFCRYGFGRRDDAPAAFEIDAFSELAPLLERA